MDAAIVAPCVEPHRTVEADQISDDLKERAGWLVTQKRCTSGAASNGSYCISLDSPGQDERTDTNLTSLSLFDQKLLANDGW